MIFEEFAAVPFIDRLVRQGALDAPDLPKSHDLANDHAREDACEGL
jgi:hypothetical protein